MNTQTTNRTQRPGGEPCEREGCPGLSFNKQPYCCFACRAIDEELATAQRVCETLGDSELTTELWTQAVALSDDFTRMLRLNFRLRRMALESGLTPKQWQDIRRGRAGR